VTLDEEVIVEDDADILRAFMAASGDLEDYGYDDPNSVANVIPLGDSEYDASRMTKIGISVVAFAALALSASTSFAQSSDWQTETYTSKPQSTPGAANTTHDGEVEYNRSDVEGLIANKSCEEIKAEQKQFFEQRDKDAQPIGMDEMSKMFAVEAFACNPNLQQWP
jgi:hypothetical protein